tara:strand:+ start:750 stop:965 length:216 start_codon:yes stop_codon:yes gene_type:complete
MGGLNNMNKINKTNFIKNVSTLKLIKTLLKLLSKKIKLNLTKDKSEKELPFNKIAVNKVNITKLKKFNKYY